jgi:hypothetical protein
MITKLTRAMYLANAQLTYMRDLREGWYTLTESGAECLFDPAGTSQIEHWPWGHKELQADRWFVRSPIGELLIEGFVDDRPILRATDAQQRRLDSRYPEWWREENRA